MLTDAEWALLDDVRAGATFEELLVKWRMGERELRKFMGGVGEKVRFTSVLMGAADVASTDDAAPRLHVPPMDPCPFCANIDGNHDPARAPAVIAEDDLIYVFLTRGPLGGLPGHTLVCPRRHAETIFDLTSDEEGALGRAVARAARVLRAEVNPHGVLIQQNNGAAAFQTVPHLHFHVVPKTVGPFPPLEPPPQIPDDELFATAARLRASWLAIG